MEKWIQKELFWNRVMFNMIRFILVFGLVLLTILFVVFAGAIAVECFGVPLLFVVGRRTETLAYGLIALVLFSAITKNGVFLAWRHALRQLREENASHVANIYRASRCSPEYYR